MKHILAVAALTVSLLALTACGDEKKDEAVKSFKSVEACKAAIAPDATQDERDKVVADCQKAYDLAKAEHEKQAPHYSTLGQCVDLYGAANCGLSPQGYYYPSMNGFFLGYLAGQMTYQPYYYNRWGVTYTGTTNLGYYRGGYVYVPRSSASWTRSYATVTVPHGNTPAPIPPSSRGVFGGSAANSGRGISVTKPAPSIGNRTFAAPPSTRGVFGGSATSAPSSSSFGNKSIAMPSSPSTRGVFGGSAASHSSSFGSSSSG